MRIILIICLCFSINFIVPFGAMADTYCPRIKACFTPGEDCTGEIVQAIDDAQHSILVQAYSFTSPTIAKALLRAKRRGVNVEVILDKSQHTQRYSSARFLTNQGIQTWIDYKPAIAHNKVIIIDRIKVITGSFNFTQAAQFKNAENLLLIDDKELAETYIANWQKRLAESENLTTYILENKRPQEKKQHKIRPKRYKNYLQDVI